MVRNAEKKELTILGIETSCDETAAAVVRGHPEGAREILSNIVFSQLDEHAPYGGVVPEIAARAHIDRLDHLVRQAMTEAGVAFGDLDGIAATAGPGLIGGVIVGLMTAKGLAAATGLPIVPVNHLEAHALTARLVETTPFPYLMLLVSGGHCQLLIAEGVGQYRPLGGTIDDAAGEAFDKVAKMLGLGFPGGPAVERAAREGNAARFDLPRPMRGRSNCDFSFSGLKTAVRHTARDEGPLDDKGKADLCAAFQEAVADCLADRTRRAMELFRDAHGNAAPTLVVAGGVAANQAIRAALGELAEENGFELKVPPPALCTDNAAMIGWAGLEHLSLSGTSGRMGSLNAPPRARWPLSSMKTA
jgi:N6-L-threonylcarbamoyladenine synthase